MNNWLGTARWTDNQVLSSIRQGPLFIKKDLCVNLVNSENFENLPLVTKTPDDIRDAAIIDVLNAYESNFSKNDNMKFIGFKKKKAPSDSIAIYSKNYKPKEVFYPTFFGEPINSAEELPDKL
jgi:hypothetical protein